MFTEKIKTVDFYINVYLVNGELILGDKHNSKQEAHLHVRSGGMWQYIKTEKFTVEL